MAEFDAKEWLISTPLYKRTELGDATRNAVRSIHSLNDAIDMFCPHCKESATFRANIDQDIQKKIEQETMAVLAVTSSSRSIGKFQSVVDQFEFRKQFSCIRVPSHRIIFYLLNFGTSIMKVGQYPSLADIAIGDTGQYVKVLGASRLEELNKAIGLAAHGVGVGSFVYLRRIIESLIEEAHTAACADAGWNPSHEELYQKSRLSENIKLLSAHLPTFIVEHPEIYGILSKGIHELSEQECLDVFETLKASIILIADEKLQEVNRQKRIEDTKLALSQYQSKTGKSDKPA